MLKSYDFCIWVADLPKQQLQWQPTDNVTKVSYIFFSRGVFVVRGENVVLLGEIDEEREAAEKASKRLQEISLEEILEAQSKQQAEKEEQEKLRQKIFKERGLTYTAEVAMDDNY